MDDELRVALATMSETELDSAETKAQIELITVYGEMDKAGISISGDDGVEDLPKESRERELLARFNHLEEWLDAIRDERRRKKRSS